MFVRSSSRVGNSIFSSQNVATRSLATQIATKIDTSSASSYEDAMPYTSIPGPSVLSLIISNFPGGSLYQKEFGDLIRITRKEYGDFAKLPGVFGNPDMIFSHKPEHFETIFRTEGKWPSRSVLGTLNYFRKKVRPDIFGKYEGLISSQNKEWSEFRTAVNPVMIHPKSAKLYISTIDEITNEFLERIRGIRHPTSNQLPENFQDMLNHWSLEAICVIAMDTRLGLISGNADSRAANCIDAVKTFFELLPDLEFKPSIWKIVSTPKFRRLMKAYDTIATLSCEYIDEAKERMEKKPFNVGSDQEQSVLEKLLKIDPIIAKVMAIDMVFVGIDTTTATFISVLYLLAKNPDKQERLREEIKTILPLKDSKLTMENMNNLPYLRACIKESLRVLPTVFGSFRLAGQDIVLDGYQVPKGTAVLMCVESLLKDDRQFPDPMKFLPERWLRQESASGSTLAPAKSAHPFAYLPFGFGPRMCIGRRFAEMKIELLLAKLLRNFHVSWEHPDLKFLFKATIIPDGKLMFTMIDVDK